uniref:Neurochondrin n=1 Tax=Lygus hesperus TaxID=30085 RepID=A0A0A9Z192_LYGHE
MSNGLDVVRDCSEMLTNADSDVEKIAALLFAAQHIRSDECDARSKAALFRSVGADFLSRMLLGRLSIPDSEDCPMETYASTALAIITGFCVDPDLARSKEMLRLVPHILKVLENCDESLLEEALQYLRCIIQHPEGRRSLLSHGALKRFASLYSRMKSDEIVAMSLILTQTPGVDDVWDRNADTFNSLMTAVALEFEKTDSERKFKLCSALRCLIYSFNKDKASNEGLIVLEWHKSVFRGLRDILTSRIDDEQRDPALKLAAMMVDHYGIHWTDSKLDHEGNRKFQLLLVHLSSIEVRMQLEDQSLEQILKNADLVTSCFTILEVAITQFLPHQDSDSRIKNQIVQSFTAASAAVVVTIKSIIEEPSSTENTSAEKFFIYAMIRFLSLGFAHEVLTTNKSVYEIMPFVVQVATDSFYSYKSWFEENTKPKTNALVPVFDAQPVNFLSVLLPALRHFATEDEGIKIILSMMDTFLDSLAFHWSAIEYYLSQKLEVTNNGDPNEKCEGLEDAKNTMVSLFELLTETVIIRPEVTDNPKFVSVFSYIAEKLPYLDPNKNELKPLHATASILGLLLIKHRKEPSAENDPNVVLVVRSSLFFLKPYFDKMPSVDEAVFASNLNPKLWVNLKELWYLGMYTLRKLLTLLPWIKPDVETALGPTIMEYLTNGDMDASGVRPE